MRFDVVFRKMGNRGDGIWGREDGDGSMCRGRAHTPGHSERWTEVEPSGTGRKRRKSRVLVGFNLVLLPAKAANKSSSASNNPSRRFTEVFLICGQSLLEASLERTYRSSSIQRCHVSPRTAATADPTSGTRSSHRPSGAVAEDPQCQETLRSPTGFPKHDIKQVSEAPTVTRCKQVRYRLFGSICATISTTPRHTPVLHPLPSHQCYVGLRCPALNKEQSLSSWSIECWLAVHRESVDETESFVPGKHTEGLQRALCGCVATSHWSFALFEPRVFLISSSFHHQSTSVDLTALANSTGPICHVIKNHCRIRCPDRDPKIRGPRLWISEIFRHLFHSKD
jgi:hypothetical protein